MPDRRDRAPELRHEMVEMALYVAVVLLATIVALPSEDVRAGTTAAAIWGGAAGLALAHWFAFNTASRLLDGLRRGDAALAAAELTAALGVAAVATIPLVLVPDDASVPTASGALTAVIAGTVFGAARTGGASRGRAAVLAAAGAVVGIGVASAKALLGH
ncbi:MAG: hypothetical protein AB7V42_15615 [Thermoleophilia bacterium]